MKKLYLIGLFVFAFCLAGGTVANAAAKVNAPSNLVASPVSNTQINLSWTDNSTDESGFVIESSPDGKVYHELARTAANTVAYSDTGLTPGTTYYYRVMAFRNDPKGIVYSKFGNVANATTAGTSPQAPANPTKLVATAYSYSRIDLVWQDNSGDEDGFAVERSLDGTNFSEVGRVGASVTVFSDNYLSSKTKYFYKVRAYRVVNSFTVYSDYSNRDNAITLNGPVLAPTNLAARASSYSQIDLTWQQNSVDEDGFAIERSLDGKIFSEIARTVADVVAYSDTGLNAKTQYYYRIRAFRNDNPTVYSNYTAPANATTPRSPLTAPSNFSVTALSYSQINLAWQDNSTNETGFWVERSPDGVNFTQIAQLDQNTIAYSDLNLTPSTLYYYRVRAYLNDNGVSYCSPYTGIKSATTLSSPLAAPSALAAAAASYSQINLTWVDNTSDESGFNIERSVDGVNFSQVAQVAADTTAYSDLSLNSNTKYYYRVRAYRTGGSYTLYSDYSAVANATTLTLSVSAPSGLAAAAVSYTQINLSWQDNSDNETAFSVERSLDGTNFFAIGEAAANATSYSDLNLVSNTTYYYRVRAKRVEVSQNIFSPYSAIATAKTAGAPSVAAPSGLSIMAKSYYEMNLVWVDNSGNETGFAIERSLNGVNYIQIDEVGANSVSYTSVGLNPGTKYYYRVRAKLAGGAETFYSSYSNVVSDTTLVPPVIAAPTNLAAAAQLYSQINLTWTDNANNETGYLIERSADGSAFSAIAAVAADTTAYSDTGLPRGTKYYYRVRAARAESGQTFYSSYSSTASATTAAGPATPAPTNLQGDNSILNELDLQWTDNANNETEYSVERSADGLNYSVIATLAADTTAYVDATVSRGQTYYYRVRTRTAENGLDFYSDYSNIFTAIALDTAPLAPSNFQMYTDGTQLHTVKGNFLDNSDNELGFIMERSIDGGVTFVEVGRLPSGDTGSWGVDFINTDSIYIPYNWYTFRVKAYNYFGESEYVYATMWYIPKY